MLRLRKVEIIRDGKRLLKINRQLFGRIGIIGHNGAGKSTLLRAIFDTEPGQDITLNGLPLNKIKERDFSNHFSAHFTKYDMLMDITSDEYLNIGLVTYNRERMSSLKSFLNYSDIEGKRLNQLSSG